MNSTSTLVQATFPLQTAPKIDGHPKEFQPTTQEWTIDTHYLPLGTGIRLTLGGPTNGTHSHAHFSFSDLHDVQANAPDWLPIPHKWLDRALALANNTPPNN